MRFVDLLDRFFDKENDGRRLGLMEMLHTMDVEDTEVIKPQFAEVLKANPVCSITPEDMEILERRLQKSEEDASQNKKKKKFKVYRDKKQFTFNTPKLFACIIGYMLFVMLLGKFSERKDQWKLMALVLPLGIFIFLFYYGKGLQKSDALLAYQNGKFKVYQGMLEAKKVYGGSMSDSSSRIYFLTMSGVNIEVQENLYRYVSPPEEIRYAIIEGDGHEYLYMIYGRSETQQYMDLLYGERKKNKGWDIFT